jgi:hypothetical protein
MKKDIFEEKLGAARSLVRVPSLLHLPMRTLASHLLSLSLSLYFVSENATRVCKLREDSAPMRCQKF